MIDLGFSKISTLASLWKLVKRLHVQLPSFLLGSALAILADHIKLDWFKLIKFGIDYVGSLKRTSTFALLKSVCSLSLFEAMFGVGGNSGSSKVAEID